MTAPRIFVLNDTDINGYHFGCTKVMETIRSHLDRRGAVVEASVKVAIDWRDQHPDLAKNANLLIINGEGSLHHGSRRSRWLLEAAAAVKAEGGKVALINALWQDNPADWGELIKDIDILSCRDARSATEMAKDTGRQDIRFFGDLTMCATSPALPSKRQGLLIGDSVNEGITNQLAALAHETVNAETIPVTTSLKLVPARAKGLRRAVRLVKAKVKQREYLAQNPSARFLVGPDDYISKLSHKELSITGRFHAVCLAVLTRTPFIAISSKSWKNEALIADLGLSPERQIDRNDLTLATIQSRDWSYTAKELANIDAQLCDWRGQADQLFDDILATAT